MIDSSRCIEIRDVTECDLPTFFEQQLDAEANRLAGFKPRDRDTFMAHWEKIMGDRSVVLKTIIFGGAVVGNIVCFERGGHRQVGYWIGREYWGKGIATAALSAFMGHVQERPLYGHVARHNVGSLRVLEKCGFTLVGQESVPADGRSEAVEEIIMKLN